MCPGIKVTVVTYFCIHFTNVFVFMNLGGSKCPKYTVVCKDQIPYNVY